MKVLSIHTTNRPSQSHETVPFKSWRGQNSKIYDAELSAAPASDKYRHICTDRHTQLQVIVTYRNKVIPINKPVIFYDTFCITSPH
jgi:hypothetical protein